MFFWAPLAVHATHPLPTELAIYEQAQDRYYRPSSPTIFCVHTNVRRLLLVQACAFGHLRRRRAHIRPQTRRQRREAAHETFHIRMVQNVRRLLSHLRRRRAHIRPQSRRQRREAAHETFHIRMVQNVRRLLSHLRRRRAHIRPQSRRQQREAAHETFHSRAHKKPQTRRQRREAAHETFHTKPQNRPEAAHETFRGIHIKPQRGKYRQV